MAKDLLAPDLSSLASLAREGNVDMRPVLLRVRSDLFLVAPARSPDMLAAFASLACGLIPVVDADTVAVVARKLAPHPQTPIEVIDSLLSRGGQIAEIVLSSSPRVSRRALREIIARGDTSLALAVADRGDLDEGLLELILERNEAVLDERLAANAAAHLSHTALEILLRRARGESALAALIAARRDIAGADKASLYAHADEDERDAIIHEVTRLVGLAPRHRAPRLKDDDAELLVSAAAEADKPSFTTALALLLQASAAQTAELVNEPSGQVLALALITVGMSREDATRIFLTLDSAIARSVTIVFGLNDLMRRVRQPVAARIVDAMLGRPAALPEHAVHLPAMAPSGTPSRPGAAQEPAREKDGARTALGRQAG